MVVLPELENPAMAINVGIRELETTKDTKVHEGRQPLKTASGHNACNEINAQKRISEFSHDDEFASYLIPAAIWGITDFSISRNLARTFSPVSMTSLWVSGSLFLPAARFVTHDIANTRMFA
jgi:hypothetical protein